VASASSFARNTIFDARVQYSVSAPSALTLLAVRLFIATLFQFRNGPKIPKLTTLRLGTVLVTRPAETKPLLVQFFHRRAPVLQTIHSCDPQGRSVEEIHTGASGRGMKVKLFSFFSGAGFLDLGFETAGFSIVFVNEYLPALMDAYKFSRRVLKVDEPEHGYHGGSITDSRRERHSREEIERSGQGRQA
jgi:hypothetical protein